MADRDSSPPAGSQTDDERETRVRALARELERDGWTGSPLVVHGDQVLGGRDRYEAARFLGIEDEVPRVGLEDVYAEAGMDLPQIASQEGSPSSGEQMFEDYLRGLPRHVRDKYEL